METLHHSLMAKADQRCTALLESLEVEKNMQWIHPFFWRGKVFWVRLLLVTLHNLRWGDELSFLKYLPSWSINFCSNHPSFSCRAWADYALMMPPYTVKMLKCLENPPSIFWMARQHPIHHGGWFIRPHVVVLVEGAWGRVAVDATPVAHRKGNRVPWSWGVWVGFDL